MNNIYQAMKIVLLLLFFSVTVSADDLSTEPLSKGRWDLGFSTGGGTGINGKTTDTQLWVTGARFGRVLSRDYGDGSVLWNMEYVFEMIPAFIVFQETTVYGFDVTPFLLKFNFKSRSGMRKPIPYFEFGIGILSTTSEVPKGTATHNFTPQMGFGLQLFTRERQAVTLALRYVHISNGGTESPNPGINSVQLTAGYQWFR